MPNSVMAAVSTPTTAEPALALAIRFPTKPCTAVADWSVRIAELDGLRGIAILLVLLRHSIFGVETHSRIGSAFLAAGQLSWSGVDLFFVLSGFLIGGILLDVRESPRYFQTFYVRRAYRILPIYMLTMALFALRHLPFHLPAGLGDVSPVPIPCLAYFTLTQNFWMAHLGTFGPAATAVTWSLAVEEQFYLTIPFAVRKLGKSALIILLAGAWLRHPCSGSFSILVFRTEISPAMCSCPVAPMLSAWEFCRPLRCARQSAGKV